MPKETVRCPICGGSTTYMEKWKQQLYICQNEECSTKLVVEKDFIFMDDTKNKDSDIWDKYRYKRLTFEELNIIAEGGKIPEKEHKEFREKASDIKIAKYLRRYKLNDIDENDLEIIKQISDDLFGLGLIKAGMALSFAKGEEQAKIGYLSALVKQNWIIIRKLDELNKKLDRAN